MESIVKADIFFFVTTICVFVVTALLVMILSHVLHIVRTVRKTVDRIHGEAYGLANDFAELREEIRKNQFGLKPIFDGIKKKADEFSGKKKPKKKKEYPPEESIGTFS